MPRAPLHDTAFVISCYRAADEPLSGDVYATHWVTAAAQAWVQAYTRDVSAFEPFVHCLRNRFFLEQIAAFFREHPGAAFVNLGCGFSAYPHLLPATHRYCDADVAEVVQYKQEKLAVWERNGTFPARAIHYVAVNLDDETSRQHFEAQLRHWLAGQASFVLLEGVLLFLKKASVLALFDMCARLQTPGSRVGAVSFVPEIRHTAVYARFLAFYRRSLGRADTDYTELEDAFYRRLPGYTLRHQTDYLALAPQYTPNRPPLSAGEILNEHLYVLERT
jgi:O-methyltransferase involved in polyketide biosynthesis